MPAGLSLASTQYEYRTTVTDRSLAYDMKIYCSATEHRHTNHRVLPILIQFTELCGSKSGLTDVIPMQGVAATYCTACDNDILHSDLLLLYRGTCPSS